MRTRRAVAWQQRRPAQLAFASTGRLASTRRRRHGEIPHFTHLEELAIRGDAQLGARTLLRHRRRLRDKPVLLLLVSSVATFEDAEGGEQHANGSTSADETHTQVRREAGGEEAERHGGEDEAADAGEADEPDDGEEVGDDREGKRHGDGDEEAGPYLWTGTGCETHARDSASEGEHQQSAGVAISMCRRQAREGRPGKARPGKTLA